jgi:hypothetical protein
MLTRGRPKRVTSPVTPVPVTPVTQRDGVCLHCDTPIEEGRFCSMKCRILWGNHGQSPSSVTPAGGSVDSGPLTKARLETKQGRP